MYHYFLKMYLFAEKESEKVSKWGQGRDRERECQADSPLSAEPEVGISLMTLRSWPEPKSGAGYSTN